MCGIAGVWRVHAGVADVDLRVTVDAMTQSLIHRGPDSDGIWIDPEKRIGLGHRRLSIVDLSPAGAQPMLSSSGRYVVSYNGEIYNHAELRGELTSGGCRFKGHSDTEVLVEGIDAWGLDATLARLVGMFAIAVWDRHDRTLTLVRDRMGIKPLYWGWHDGALVFCSELKALKALPGWRPEIDRDALTAFMRYSYVPAPHTIYDGIQKLEPGSLITVDATGAASQKAYWDTRSLMQASARRHPPMSDMEAADHLDSLLRDAVSRRMLADVPVGAFLSGGIDSSLVVAEMQAAADRPVRTFSIGFDDAGYDEAPYAKAVAAHLGTDHTEFYVTSAEARDVIPELPRWYDEPFADSSQIPMSLVSRLARRHVTVSLSGDGGDELFAGYTRYTTAQTLWQPLQRMPVRIRRSLPALIGLLNTRQWDGLARCLPARRRPPHFGQRLYKLKDAIGADEPNDFYRPLLSQWRDPASVVIGGHDLPHLLDDPTLIADVPDMVERMQLIDMLTYLPDDILTKVDRASMAVGLEARVPLLDHRVVEFACSLPASMRIRDGQSKWLLRRVLDRYVPQSHVERPKMGFGVPIDRWLRGPLRDWAETLLDPARLRAEGFFEPKPIREKWTQHLSGEADWQHPLWNVLMFQAWWESLSA